jgi:hypothetical protein
MQECQEGDRTLTHSLRPFACLLGLLTVLACLLPAVPVAAVPTPGHLPVWEEGFSWSYEVDHDVEYDLGFIQVNHITENWTRVVDQVLDVGGEKQYKVWESRKGTIRGTVTYGLTFPVSANARGTGWTFIRASDMAVLNQTFDLTFSGNLPIGGSFSGGFDNTTTYDPPMPMLEFPVPSSEWRVRSIVNTTTEFYVTAPATNSTWYNTSEVWDLNVTATGPSSFTVPAGTYDAFQVHEVGSVSNATDTWPVDRRWYYADEALNVVRTYEGHDLVWTDAVYTPPNSPPEGPSGTVPLSTDEDVPLEVDLSGYFSDPDGDDLAYTLELAEGSAANASMVREGPVWNVTPNADWNGQLHLTASASDPFGQAATGDLVITVSPVNDAPYVAWEPNDLATEEDMPLRAAHDAAEIFDDVDGDPLTYSANATTGVTALMNGTTVDLVPDPDWTGRAVVTLEAHDPSGETAEASFDLLVGEVNDPPSIVDSGGPARIHEGEEGEFWVEVVDTDSEDLEYTWSVDGYVDASATGPSFTYAVGDLTVSSVTVAVKVEDEWNAMDEMSWDVTIQDSPVIVSMEPDSPVAVLVGDTVTFTVSVEDADTPEPDYTWSWNGDLVGSGTDLPMLFGARDVGNDILVVVVDDGVANDTAEWEVNVTVPNEAPTVQIKRVADAGRPTVGVKYFLSASVSDDDMASVSVQWTIDGSPAGNSIDLSWTPTEAGTFLIQVTASDGEYNATDSLTLDVVKENVEDGTGDTFPWGTVFAVVIILVILALVVAYAVRSRTG